MSLNLNQGDYITARSLLTKTLSSHCENLWLTSVPKNNTMPRQSRRGFVRDGLSGSITAMGQWCWCERVLGRLKQDDGPLRRTCNPSLKSLTKNGPVSPLGPRSVLSRATATTKEHRIFYAVGSIVRAGRHGACFPLIGLNGGLSANARQ